MKLLTLSTVIGLVLATATTVAVGSNGVLWFAWVVLVLVTLVAWTSRR